MWWILIIHISSAWYRVVWSGDGAQQHFCRHVKWDAHLGTPGRGKGAGVAIKSTSFLWYSPGWKEEISHHLRQRSRATRSEHGHHSDWSGEKEVKELRLGIWVRGSEIGRKKLSVPQEQLTNPERDAEVGRTALPESFIERKWQRALYTGWRNDALVF